VLEQRKPANILMVDDDEDDCLLVRDVFKENGLSAALQFLENGEELMSYLRRQGKYREMPRPDLILLDLNMPRKDGREALQEIKSDSSLRSIPVIILTTSKEERDISFCYDAGASAYITKPGAYDDLTQALGALAQFWFRVVSLPTK
jgi:CheY-like chemotaxis protein